MSIDLRLGDWRDVLADVECDALITDPPYGERTHVGHDAATESETTTVRNAISYTSWSPDDVAAFVESWSPRVRGWFCAMTSHDLVPAWEASFAAAGRYCFAPVPCVMRGMSVRQQGDGPSSWSVSLVVARPREKRFLGWGALPGSYVGVRGNGGHIGGKPEWLMRAIVGDYSKSGDVVCDPCAGGATTLIAASGMGRFAIGSEMDPDTYARAMERIGRGVQYEMAL